MRNQGLPDTGLSGRVAVVTGAGSGMGRAMALELARRGVKLAAVDVDRDRLERLAEEVGANADSLLVVPTDISRAEECRRAVERIVAAFGDLAILINCAGFQWPQQRPPASSIR